MLAFSLAASYRQAPTEANQWKSKTWFSLRIPVSVDVCMRERNKKGIKTLKTAVTGASVLASLAAAAAARQHSGEGESSRSRFLVSSKRKHSEAHPSSEHFFFSVLVTATRVEKSPVFVCRLASRCESRDEKGNLQAFCARIAKTAQQSLKTRSTLCSSSLPSTSVLPRSLVKSKDRHQKGGRGGCKLFKALLGQRRAQNSR